jgi:Uma2 family endonuclease
MSIPPLEQGDRLSRDEFERRYHAMPHVKKAELIEGVVYMPSPARYQRHSGPQSDAITWLGVYKAATPGVESADNATDRLDLDNEPQPDAMLFIEPACGGQVRISEDDYIEGAPELIVEVTSSSASYDLGDKMKAYRRNGVREYVVWRVLDGAIDWFALRKGEYHRQEPRVDGLLCSDVFPGLWLDREALLRRDLASVLAALQKGSQAESTQSLSSDSPQLAESSRVADAAATAVRVF